MQISKQEELNEAIENAAKTLTEFPHSFYRVRNHIKELVDAAYELGKSETLTNYLVNINKLNKSINGDFRNRLATAIENQDEKEMNKLKVEMNETITNN